RATGTESEGVAVSIGSLVSGNLELRMVKSNTSDAQVLIRSLHSTYAATPTNLRVLLLVCALVELPLYVLVEAT
ncbi:unnamed protein product, partial [Musa banksii]